MMAEHQLLLLSVISTEGYARRHQLTSNSLKKTQFTVYKNNSKEDEGHI